MGDFEKGDRVKLQSPSRRHANTFGYDFSQPVFGVVVNALDGVVDVEFDPPVPRLLLSGLIVDDEPMKYEDHTSALGYGLAEAMEDAKDLPPGRYNKNYMLYHLDEPIGIDVIKDFCKQRYPGEPRCWRQSLMVALARVSTQNPDLVQKV